jgi:ABC-type phosphate/phosphonate transport system permease subunit
MATLLGVRLSKRIILGERRAFKEDVGPAKVTNARLGTAAAFLAQITLGASVWQTYKQWIWRSVKKAPLTMATLNDIFGVQTSVLSFLNVDMFKNFRTGYVIALFGWYASLFLYHGLGAEFHHSLANTNTGRSYFPLSSRPVPCSSTAALTKSWAPVGFHI